MTRPAGIGSQVALWALVLGLWALLVVGFAAQLVFTTEMPASEALRVAARDWLPWVVLAPLVVWTAWRFPFERGRWPLSLGVHLAACALALAACEWFARAVAPEPLPARFRFRGPPPGAGPEGRLEPFPPPQTQPGAPLRGPLRQPPVSPDAGPAPPLQPPPPGAEPRPLEPREVVRRNVVLRAKFNLPVYWVLVSLAHALQFYRRAEERARKAVELEARLADAKLQALRMQLHPHFLFNTLNAIAALVHKDARAADEMIGNLSELLRATLDTAAQEISLRQELEFLDRYLEIQQMRFGERLRVEKDLDAAALDALVPTLILQPLVENAIRHGIEPASGPGVVTVRARRSDHGMLRLSVCDTGGGPARREKSSPGIGLANTRARLEALYGRAAQLNLHSDAEGRFTVEMEIPFREASATRPAEHEHSSVDRG
ncbi:MAG: histidine kinase [Verrucomicrobiae bacterium]|nr:histidine kinase [Verrucomicrobiae bacterium]